jgi:NADH-quinone oxidoreductase subunit J
VIDFLLLNLEVLLLIGFAGGALVGAASMIVMRQPMRVAMALIATMTCLGGIYGLLGVHFIAAFQVLIYVGAVMVFMVYVIMLLDVRDEGGPAFAKWKWPGLAGFALLLAVIVGSVWKALPAGTGESSSTAFGMSQFSRAFLNEYWLHFELTSVLLVAAVVAALAVIKVSRRADREAQAVRDSGRVARAAREADRAAQAVGASDRTVKPVSALEAASHG